VNQQVEDIFQLIGNFLLIWAAVMATASVVLHLRVPWRSSAMGRHLMAYMAVMAAVLVLGVVRIVLGDSWWFQLIRLVTFIGVPIVMSWRVWLQVKAQRVQGR
jgi:hypothetical protein